MRTVRNAKQWLRSCYCCHRCHKLGHWGMTSSGYDRVTIVTNSDTEEWQAVATIALVLSQTRTLRNNKQWLRLCYCCHKLGHWGMTSSGYDCVSHMYIGLNIFFGMHEVSLNINPIYWRKPDVDSETKKNHLKVLRKVWRCHKWRILQIVEKHFIVDPVNTCKYRRQTQYVEIFYTRRGNNSFCLIYSLM